MEKDYYLQNTKINVIINLYFYILMDETFDGSVWLSEKWKLFDGNYTNITTIDPSLTSEKIQAIARVYAQIRIKSHLLRSDIEWDKKWVFNLANWIPEAAKKFWILEEGMRLLSKYGIKAEFSPAYHNNMASSYDRIDLRNANDDDLKFSDAEWKNIRTPLIPLISDSKNNPVFPNIFIEEDNNRLYLEYWNNKLKFRHWFKKI